MLELAKLLRACKPGSRLRMDSRTGLFAHLHQELTIKMVWAFSCCDCLTCVDNMLNGRTYSAKTKATEQIKSTTELFSSNQKWSMVWLLIWVAQKSMMLLRLNRSWWGQKIHPCNKLQMTCTIEVKVGTLPIIHFLYIRVIHFGVFVL